MSDRVTWRGHAMTSEEFLILHSFGLAAVGGPGSEHLGIEANGEPQTLVFRDANGAEQTARVGDEIENTPRGWILHPAAPTTGEANNG